MPPKKYPPFVWAKRLFGKYLCSFSSYPVMVWQICTSVYTWLNHSRVATIAHRAVCQKYQKGPLTFTVRWDSQTNYPLHSRKKAPSALAAFAGQGIAQLKTFKLATRAKPWATGGTQSSHLQLCFSTAVLEVLKTLEMIFWAFLRNLSYAQFCRRPVLRAPTPTWGTSSTTSEATAPWTRERRTARTTWEGPTWPCSPTGRSSTPSWVRAILRNKKGTLHWSAALVHNFLASFMEKALNRLPRNISSEHTSAKCYLGLKRI